MDNSDLTDRSTTSLVSQIVQQHWHSLLAAAIKIHPKNNHAQCEIIGQFICEKLFQSKTLTLDRILNDQDMNRTAYFIVAMKNLRKEGHRIAKASRQTSPLQEEVYLLSYGGCYPSDQLMQDDYVELVRSKIRSKMNLRSVQLFNLLLKKNTISQIIKQTGRGKKDVENRIREIFNLARECLD